MMDVFTTETATLLVASVAGSERKSATVVVRATRNQIADPPSALALPVRKPRPVQLKLFGRVP